MKFNKILAAVAVILFISTQSASFAAISTDAKLHYNKGIDYYQLGQLEESVKCFKEAIELDPNYIDAYYNLGSLLEYMKQYEAALAVFKQIILRKPDDYEAVYKAVSLSKKIGEFDKARMYLELIPTDTLIGQRATQLANSLPKPEEEKPIEEKQIEETPTTDANTQQTIAEEIQQEQVQRYESENPQYDSHATYSDITSPTGITTDSSGNLFVAGFSDNTIYKISPDNKKIVYIKSEKIDGPIGLAMDADGNIYIANYNKNNVLKVSSTGEITELISNIENPYCIYYTNGCLFISSQGSNSVLRYKLGK